MSKKKSNQSKNPLDGLLRAAEETVLRRLIEHVAAHSPEVRRQCLDFLRQHVQVPAETKAAAAGDAAWAIWEELEPDLAELDEYGGGPDKTVYRVAKLLSQVEQKLQQAAIPREDRQRLRDEVVVYIRRGNAGLDDGLYDVAYATCKDDEDWYDLAEQLADLGKDWPRDHARRIYRKLGDRDRYLALRQQRMEYGGDYHDLATFYWEQGERDRALATAHEGMQKGKGRMDELRAFLAERAEETGDRSGYLELQFGQAVSRLSLESYQAFHRLCTPEEWAVYEPRLLTALERVRPEERLQVLVHRGDHEQAIRLLCSQRYPDATGYGESELLRVATELEEKYPTQILAFYQSGLGNLQQTSQRNVYAHKAQAAKKVRHVLVDILEEPRKWEQLARPIKVANQNRPAFQEEFAKVVPGWRQL